MSRDEGSERLHLSARRAHYGRSEEVEPDDSGTRISQAFLRLFLTFLSLEADAGLYETRVLVPLWSASPPETVRGWDAPLTVRSRKRFWKLLHPALRGESGSWHGGLPRGAARVEHPTFGGLRANRTESRATCGERVAQSPFRPSLAGSATMVIAGRGPCRPPRLAARRIRKRLYRRGPSSERPQSVAPTPTLI